MSASFIKLASLTECSCRPVQSVAIHDHLRAKLCDLYENDGIFDKFECSFSNDSSRVVPLSKQLRF